MSKKAIHRGQSSFSTISIHWVATKRIPSILLPLRKPFCSSPNASSPSTQVSILFTICMATLYSTDATVIGLCDLISHLFPLASQITFVWLSFHSSVIFSSFRLAFGSSNVISLMGMPSRPVNVPLETFLSISSHSSSDNFLWHFKVFFFVFRVSISSSLKVLSINFLIYSMLPSLSVVFRLAACFFGSNLLFKGFMYFQNLVGALLSLLLTCFIHSIPAFSIFSWITPEAFHFACWHSPHLILSPLLTCPCFYFFCVSSKLFGVLLLPHHLPCPTKLCVSVCTLLFGAVHCHYHDSNQA